MRRMSGLDASFLYMETPTTHMHIVGVVLLESADGRVAGFEEIESALRERLHMIPPLRRRMVPPPGAIDHPVWIEDPDFDLAHHLHREDIPGPVSWARLQDVVGAMTSRPLRRDRPLWEMCIVEGVEGDSTAIVTKLHHSMMDGGAGYDLMASMFDLSADAPSPPPPEEDWVPEPVPTAPQLVAGSISSYLRRQVQVPATVISTAGTMVGAARTWIGQKVNGNGGSLEASRTLFNGPLTARRSVSLCKVDLDDVKTIRKAFGTTVNDVVLAATAKSVKNYLSLRGGLPSGPLLAAVPVNVRDESARGELGNQVSNMMVSIPMDVEDPVELLGAIHTNALASKALQSAIGPDLLNQVSTFIAPSLISAVARSYSGMRLVRFHKPVFNLVVSNVPGPPIDLYCAGSRVSAIFPMGPLLEGSGLNLTVLSEAHHLNVGVMACPDLVTTVDEIGDGFLEAVNDLLVRARNAR